MPRPAKQAHYPILGIRNFQLDSHAKPVGEIFAYFHHVFYNEISYKPYDMISANLITEGQPKTTTVKAPLTGPTRSDTWLTVVPDAAPRYNTLLPGFMCMLSTPPRIAAANLDRKGFHALYSILVSPA